MKEYQACADLFPGSFSPAGNEIIFVPHIKASIEIFSFPGFEKIAEIDQEKLFEGRDEFPGANVDRADYMAQYLSATTILVKTTFGRLLLLERNTLQCIGELFLEGCPIKADEYRGEPVSDPTVILVYDSGIFSLKLTDKEQLIVIHSSDTINIYQCGHLRNL